MQRSIRAEIKSVLRSLSYARDTGNREQAANCKEIIRKVWRHRNSGKPVSAVL